jgi:hypothetical protein
MTVACSTVKVALDTVGPAAISGPLVSHVDSCATCAADVAVFGSIEVELAELLQDEFVAPSGFQASVMDSLGPVAVPDWVPPSSRSVPLAAAMATAAVATAAAGTAVILRLRRSRAA